jgi:hypothetical protein
MHSLLSLEDLLRRARGSVKLYGTIRMDIAAQLMGRGCDVPALERRLINEEKGNV